MTTMRALLHRRIIPAAYDVLPPEMRSVPATALLLAIALQESDRLKVRRQYSGGPARGFWQFEKGGGVREVLEHSRTRLHLLAALKTLRYQHDGRVVTSMDACYAALEHNDVLAAVFARLLLWTLPHPLPDLLAVEEGWRQYLSAWRPGKPHPETWEQNWTEAWRTVRGETEEATT